MEMFRHLRKSVTFVQLHRAKCRFFRNGLSLIQYGRNMPSAPENSIRRYKKLPFEVVNTNVSRDVLLYKYDQTGLFRTISIFGMCLGFFSTYLIATILRIASDPPTDPSEDEWWKNTWLWKNKFKTYLVTLVFFCGFAAVGGTTFYSARRIRYIWLLKGGEKVLFATYGPFAMETKMTVPLRNISSQTFRSDEKKALLFLQVKGKMGSFAIDNRGSFPNALLFDHTVGMKRAIKTKK